MNLKQSSFSGLFACINRGRDIKVVFPFGMRKQAVLETLLPQLSSSIVPSAMQAGKPLQEEQTQI